MVAGYSKEYKAAPVYVQAKKKAVTLEEIIDKWNSMAIHVWEFLCKPVYIPCKRVVTEES